MRIVIPFFCVYTIFLFFSLSLCQIVGGGFDVTKPGGRNEVEIRRGSAPSALRCCTVEKTDHHHFSSRKKKKVRVRIQIFLSKNQKKLSRRRRRKTRDWRLFCIWLRHPWRNLAIRYCWWCMATALEKVGSWPQSFLYSFGYSSNNELKQQTLFWSIRSLRYSTPFFFLASCAWKCAQWESVITVDIWWKLI